MKRFIVSLVICVMAALSTAACTSSCPPGMARMSKINQGWMVGYLTARAQMYADLAQDQQKPNARREALSAFSLLDQVMQQIDEGRGLDDDKVMKAAHQLASVERQIYSQ